MRLKRLLAAMVTLCALVTIASCDKLTPAAPDDDTVLDGTIDNLTSEQSMKHPRGDIAFNNQIFTPETGLGPVFVATSCGSCHAGDGKGHPFTTLTRFGQKDSTGNTFIAQGGPPITKQGNTRILSRKKSPAGASFAKFTPPSNTV